MRWMLRVQKRQRSAINIGPKCCSKYCLHFWKNDPCRGKSLSFGRNEGFYIRLTGRYSTTNGGVVRASATGTEGGGGGWRWACRGVKGARRPHGGGAGERQRACRGVVVVEMALAGRRWRAAVVGRESGRGSGERAAALAGRRRRNARTAAFLPVAAEDDPTQRPRWRRRHH